MKLARFGLIVALLLAGAANAAEPVHITVAASPGALPHWLPLYVARAKFFADEGLIADWVPLRSGSAEVAAVLGGSAQIAPVNVELTALAHQNGGDLVMICDVFDVQPYSIVLSDAVIARVGITPGMPTDDILNRLKGLKIAITGPGSATDNYIRHAMQLRGMDPDAMLSLQPLGDPDAMLAALQRKLIDGFVMSSPADLVVQQRKLGRPVLDAFSGALPELKGVPFAGLVTSRAQLDAKPAVFAAILRAMTRSIRLLHDHPDQAKALVRPYFKDLDDDTFTAMMAKYMPGAATTPVLSKAQFDAALHWASIGAAEPITAPYDAVVDTKLAEAALVATQ